MARQRDPAINIGIFVALGFMGLLTALFLRRGLSSIPKMAVENQNTLAPVICVSHGGGMYWAFAWECYIFSQMTCSK